MANKKKKGGKGEKKQQKQKTGKKEKKGKKEKHEKKKKEKRDATPLLAMQLLEHVTMDVRSASAIAPLGEGFALVVDDDEGIFLVGGGGAPELLRGRDHAKGLGDLESVCVSDDGKTAYAVSEEKGQVFSFEITRKGGRFALSTPTLLGRLDRPGDVKNKGWEGASYRAASPDSGGAPCLVVSHECDPAAIGVFTLPDLREIAMIELEGVLADLLDDVADVDVCPTTGNLFLLSDQSNRVVEASLDLVRGELELVAGFDLELDAGEKPEGIAFESPDRLLIVTDATSRALRFSVAR